MMYFVEVARRHRTTALEEYLADHVMKTYNGALVTAAQADDIPSAVTSLIEKLRQTHPNWGCGEISTTGFARRKNSDDRYRLVKGAQGATVYIPSPTGGVSKSFLLTIKPVLHDYTDKQSDK